MSILEQLKSITGRHSYMGQEPRGSNAVMTDDAPGRERPQTTEPERQTVTDTPDNTAW